ncbi:hypothetical protein [Salegentibacter chungangensis]|uniref:Biopolymer transporter Tol n=1 Tax=Salegentibacter chungangensis TaxID=1335724 RepID=A0ABW3NT09_9FLAO
MEKIIIFIILSLFSFFGIAQQPDPEGTDHYIQVFINTDGEIWLERDLVKIDEIKKQVDKIIRQIPFRPDRKLIFRIFADENLSLGFIQNVENEMLKAYSDNVMRERYLLDSRQMNLDGPGWLQNINFKELKAIHSDGS